MSGHRDDGTFAEDKAKNPNRLVGRNRFVRHSLMTQYGISDKEARDVIDMHHMNKDTGDELFFPQKAWAELSDQLGRSPRYGEEPQGYKGIDPTEMVKVAVKNVRNPKPMSPDYGTAGESPIKEAGY